MKKFIESLRNDKKKGIMFLLIIGALILVIILGFIYGVNGTSAEEKKINEASLIVPVDTVAINKENEEVSNASFFSVPENQNNTLLTDDTGEKPIEEPVVVQSTRSNNNYHPKRVYTSKPKEYYLNSNETNANNEPKEVVETTPVAVQKRKRTPNDNLGNYQKKQRSNKTMYNAVIANNNQIVKTGTYVSIRLAEDITIDNLLIPRNSIVTGIASYNNQRMAININSVKVGSVIKSVKWMVVDEDGNDGVAIPDRMLNDLAKDGATEVVDKSGSEINTNVPFVGNVKLNLKKRASEISFVLNSGHRLYIKEKES
jgi:hypothetical protein